MTEPMSKVLLVEDNPGDARLLREFLNEVTSLRFHISHVESLTEALSCLGQEDFDAILLDLSLPDGHGLDNVRRVLEVAPNLPILVLTGLDDEDMALKALRVGAQDYLVKGQSDGWSISKSIRYSIERKQILQENARLLIQTQKNLDRIRVLREVEQAITSTFDVDTILAELLEKMEASTPFVAACVRKMNWDAQELEPIAYRNLKSEDVAPITWSGQEDTQGEGGESSSLLVIKHDNGDTQVDERTFLQGKGWCSALVVPLKLQDKVWGMISFYMASEHDFSPEELAFMGALAGQASVAIHNAELYQGMVKLADDLARSNKVKDEFLSIMSHELRTPLNVVMNCAEVIRMGMMGDVTPQQVDVLDRLISQAKNQLSLVNTVLDATRMETQELELCNNELRLEEFLNDLRIDYEFTFSKPDVRLCWNIPAHLPVVALDQSKVRQIIENLINNAIKFTEQGEITTSVNVDYAYQKSNTLHGGIDAAIRIAVTDTGMGIPDEDKQIIFEKFHQVDTSATRNHGGVGIGLYLVKRFTQLFKGEITLESEIGKGSTFAVTIPCSVLSRPDAMRDAEPLRTHV